MLHIILDIWQDPEYASEYTRKISVLGVFLVPMQENTDQKNSEYGHFSRRGG